MEREGLGPLVVECTRGPAVESRHLVDAAVVDPAGRLVQGWGETGAVVYPRSAIKSVQVLPLLESGAAERYAVSDEEVALACSSHNGQPAHVAVVRGWLARAGLGEDDLECGPHLPYHTPSAHACVREGEAGRAVHNMCSGKHSAFLVTARALGEPTQGYIARGPSGAEAGLGGHRRPFRLRSRAGAVGDRWLQHPDDWPAALRPRARRGQHRGPLRPER